MFQKVRCFVCLGFVLIMTTVLISGVAWGASTVTIVGEVNDDFQIIADGDQVYEIMTDDNGEELAGHAGEKVKVAGEIVEDEGDRVIKVLSYEVLE